MPSSISVVIPFYHAEDFFEQTYQTVKQQTLAADEIVVVIDGCGKKAEDFLAQFSDLIVISLPENVGPAKARNIGVENAKGELIAFLDADDKWEANKLEKQVAFLADNPEFAACHTGIKTFNGETVGAIFNDKPYSLSVADLLASSHVVPTSLLMKKSAFDAVNGFDTEIHCSEDHDFTIRLVDNDLPIGFLAEPLSYLRREDHGNISSNGRKILIGHFQLLKKHWALYKEHKEIRSWFVYKTFMSCGGKSSGLEQKLYYMCGKVVDLIFGVNKTAKS